MAGIQHELNPVDRITTGAIGDPGKRVFYLQGRAGDQLVTLIVEKQQIQSLAIGLEEFLDELHKRLPDLPESSGDYIEEEMALEEPIDPAFRVGHMGLGYDEKSDMLILVARETQPLDHDPGEASFVRFWCSRSHMRRMCSWGLDLSSRGRPICGNCGEPIDPRGHFCPKKNGHKR
ncbi:MAG: DUF3090 domain-containing protein [Anaerolineales bacterium]